jgi:uncharacterized protein (UPF0335 family)
VLVVIPGAAYRAVGLPVTKLVVNVRPPRFAEAIQKSRGFETMAKTGGIAAERLKSFIERIERLEEEKAALAADVREVYAEAKGTGFDTKIMRQIVKLRKMDEAARAEQDALLDLYKKAIGLAG